MKKQFLTVIVEQQPIMRIALSTALSTDNLNVIASFDLRPGIVQSIQSLHPEVILFSVSNPGINELNVLQKLRSALPHVTLAALLTGENPGQSQDAFEYGADLTLEKIQPKQDILSAIEQFQRQKSPL